MWFLPDGAGLHAPLGNLVTEEGTGRLCCHLCGGWFTALGIHVRAHGFTAGTYRQAMGLPVGLPLVAAGLSASMARNTRDRWAASRLRGKRPAGRPVVGLAGGLPNHPQAARAAGAPPGPERRSPAADAALAGAPERLASSQPGRASIPDSRPPGYRSEGWTVILREPRPGRAAAGRGGAFAAPHSDHPRTTFITVCIVANDL